MSSTDRIFRRVNNQHRADDIMSAWIDVRDRVRAALGERFAAIIRPFTELLDVGKDFYRIDTVSAILRCLADMKQESRDTRADQVMLIAAGVEMLESENTEGETQP